MKNRLLILPVALLLSGCAARAQTVTVTFKSKAENLTTRDSLSATKPCNGITESLTINDLLGIKLAHNFPVAMGESIATTDQMFKSAVLAKTIADNGTTADSLSSAYRTGSNFIESLATSDNLLLVLTVMFPRACALAVSGNSITCTVSSGP